MVPGAERGGAARGAGRRGAATGLLAVVVGVVLLAGCSAGPARETKAAGGKPPASARRAPRPEVAVPAASDWESFAKCRSALAAEIERRAAAMKTGPVGSGATELASLRLAASTRDLIDSGSLAAARQSAQRAISLWGGDGWAYLWLAYVHHVEGRSEQAAEFVAKARRHLPRDAGMAAEVEGLSASIRSAS